MKDAQDIHKAEASFVDMLIGVVGDQAPGEVLILSSEDNVQPQPVSLSSKTEWMNLAEVAADLDRLGSRRWSLVCVLDPQIPSASLTTLLARIRDLHAVKVLHLDRCTRWSLADSLALGFSQLASGCSLLGQHGTMVDFTAFEFEIRNYKQVPDWLNAKNWANPELWGKHSW